MRKEIGSEFWDIPISKEKNNLFPEDTKWFLSGRIALKCIIEDCDIKSVSMPRWCCKSMIVPFLEGNVEVSYYDVIPNINCDAIYLIDYFGFNTGNTVNDLYSGIVIRDITHSVFSRKYTDADYYFGSLRKWAGFVTGGFAYGKWKKNLKCIEADNEYVALRKEAMLRKKNYIEGNSNSKSYLDIYHKANELLDHCGICSAIKEDTNAAKYLDVEFIRRTRRQNAEFLLDHLNGIYKLGENDCPLFVPIRIKNRDALRRFLFDNEIYCPVHWPNMDLGGTELSIVCDQRYDIEDMKSICKMIEIFRKEVH